MTASSPKMQFSISDLTYPLPGAGFRCHTFPSSLFPMSVTSMFTLSMVNLNECIIRNNTLVELLFVPVYRDMANRQTSPVDNLLTSRTSSAKFKYVKFKASTLAAFHLRVIERWTVWDNQFTLQRKHFSTI